MASRNVLVFGSSNAGKTSMINMLTHNNYPVNNSACGCTFETVSIPPVTNGEIQYHFLDTAGLNETDKGTVKSKDAVKNIVKLLKHSKSGMNLLIYVMRIGTISQTEKDNVNMFCNVITGNMIPTICVITGCENEEPMTQWVTNNRHIFQQNGMVFMDMVGTCFASGGRFETSFKPLREDSARRVWDAITTHSAQEPVDFVKKSGGMIAVVKRVWNAFCTWIGQPAWRWVNEHVKNMLIRLGFRSDEADEIAEEF
ncbi:unnamed protein product [Rotaria socialis]|uniref:G domain-containing protein n=1 Tax=Rotaria socialis TaxID=392032 RepID=A0A818NIC3_9BILA|nr:unnamed protein product [Rotaria socialis]CAF3607508.1 unnamed protein product [Rotaria socialis]CAF4505265.1 unnamed protein product [Rotaria socialis]CAF4840607.1 unnamed protein product [Rotaria socialis]